MIILQGANVLVRSIVDPKNPTIVKERHADRLTGKVIADIGMPEGCTRKWALGGDDYIKVKFTLDKPIDLNIGDFVMYKGQAYAITQDYTPAYNTTTGGYDYDVQFEAYYHLLGNVTAMLTEKSGADYVRMESRWQYTGSLEYHLDILAYNINAIWFYIPYGEPDIINDAYVFRITQLARLEFDFRESDFRMEGETLLCHTNKFITFDGKSMLEAFNELCTEENFNCEWWYDDKQHKIIFGHCGGLLTQDEREANRGVIISATNTDKGDMEAESIRANNSQKEYYTRLRLFGGTQNLTSEYGKSIVLRYEPHNYSGIVWPLNGWAGKVLYTDINAWANIEYLDTPIDVAETVIYTEMTSQEYPQKYWATAPITLASAMGRYYFDPIEVTCLDIPRNAQLVIALQRRYKVSGSYGQWETITGTERELNNAHSVVEWPTIVENEDQSQETNWRIICGWTSQFGNSEFEASSVEIGYFEIWRDDYARKTIELDEVDNKFQYTGQRYKLIVEGSTLFKNYQLKFAWDVTPAQLANLVVKANDVNFANKMWTSDLYHEVGDNVRSDLYNMERRLLMQCGDARVDYVDADGYADIPATRIVEKVEIDDTIYPSIKMMNGLLSQTTSVTSNRTKTLWEYKHPLITSGRPAGNTDDMFIEEEELTDGSKSDKYFEYYVLNDTLQSGILTKQNGSTYGIEKSWLIEGQTLRVHFNRGFLGGMEFEARIMTARRQDDAQAPEDKTLGKVLVIIPNENYGQYLPNDSLFPQKGDEYVILGWNPKYLGNTACERDAANRLYQEARERVNNAVRDHKTYSVRMMCDSVSRIEYSQLVGADGNAIKTKNDEYFKVADATMSEDVILDKGTGVRLTDRGMFKGWYKTTRYCSDLMRVVGFEYPLDIPADGLIYTVGETPVLKGNINTLKRALNIK